MGLLRGSSSGLTVGFFLGLIQDSFSGGLFGSQAFSKTIWGYLSGMSVSQLDPKQPVVQLMLIFVFSLGDALLVYFIHRIFVSSAPLFNGIILIVMIIGQIIYNLALWPIIYHLGIKLDLG